MSIQKLSKPLTDLERNLKVNEFLSKGGTVPDKDVKDKNHKLLLRIPKKLIDQIDAKRGSLVSESRNLWILKAIEKSLKD